MAEQQQDTQFRFRAIELYKSESLGSGSYGKVCRAKCDGLPCAAKIMHPTLCDMRDPGKASYFERFERECYLLSLAKHPNIVQYLATYCDPETNLPFLVMELCDESLTKFLERSPGPLPYHIELNISHDIALALVYLHSNGLIHRDLTANNVLMIAGVRAKVTDFGMSKLANVNPRMTAMTLCPGNQQYMSPEALEEPPSYTEKLDIFSFGVLLVQIMTRQFPKAGHRFRIVNDSRYNGGIVRILVPETQRRSAHIKLISGTHPLKEMALNCLKDEERQRPSAVQLSNSLSELKEAPQYTGSQTVEGNGQEVGTLRRQVRDLQQRDQQQRQEIEGQQRAAEQQRKSISQQQQENRMLQQENNRTQQQIQPLLQQDKRRQQEIQHLLQQDRRQQQEIQHLLQQDQRQQQEIERQRHEIEQAHLFRQQIVAHAEQLEQQLKGRRVLTESKTREIQQLKQEVEEKERELQYTKQLTQEMILASAAERNTIKLSLEEGKKAPEGMRRGAVVANENTVYFNPVSSSRVYSCQISSGDQQWSTLPDNHRYYFSLAVIGGFVTSIGGQFHQCGGLLANTLLSLTGEGRERKWSEVFLPMPTARNAHVSVTTEQTLVVAGGYDGNKCLDTVEVMDVPTKQWSTASRLPRPFTWMSAAVCGDQLYLAGGYGEESKPSKSVLTCSLPDLLRSQSLGTTLQALSLASKPGVWRQIKELPVTQSTLIALGGHLVAIGGANDSNTPTDDVHCCEPQTDAWHVTTKMKSERSRPMVAVLPGDRLIIVGGRDVSWQPSDSVEIGSLLVS